MSEEKSPWRDAIRTWRHGRVGRRCVQAAHVLRAPRQLLLREREARNALRAGAPCPGVDRSAGYLRLEAGSIPGVDRVLAQARRVLQGMATYVPRIQAASHGKLRLTMDLSSDELHRRDPVFVEFVLQDFLLLRVVEYLRTVPYLARVSLPLSLHLPELSAPGFHQRFHVDNDDFRQIKLFLNAQEVGIEDGPSCFLPADVSRRVLRGLRRQGRTPGAYGTFSDEEVFRHCDPSEVVRLTGPPGTAVLFDASRCLHYGSRIGAGRERLMIWATYLRYHRLHENPSSQFESGSIARDALRRLALDPPVRRPIGTFCHDPLRALGEGFGE